MALRAEQLKDELTEDIVRQVRDRLDRARARTAERFVRQFYANVPPDDILQASSEQLYGAALAMWQWGQQRQPGKARVRVYNPRMEEHGWQSNRTVVEIVNDDMPFLVDSVTAELNRRGLTVHLVIHPVVRVARDAAGQLTALADPALPDASRPDAADPGAPIPVPPIPAPPIPAKEGRPANPSCMSRSAPSAGRRCWPASATGWSACWPTCAPPCRTGRRCATACAPPWRRRRPPAAPFPPTRCRRPRSSCAGSTTTTSPIWDTASTASPRPAAANWRWPWWRAAASASCATTR
ncbi:hypothetical protein [Azospirillum thermophilum]|uniref:hypothetical protein n=1 Tax=Azospirillum thermophilum TaxID=2202148 RepID=UPI003182E928